MALVEIELRADLAALPPHVTRYLHQMAPEVERFRSLTPGGFRGFVPCDYRAFYMALADVVARRLACGNTFCEWGSGLGVATCLASMLGFDAHGIEFDAQLVEAAEQYADQFQIAANFVHGSCLPPGVDDLVDIAYAEHDGLISMVPHADDAYSQLGRDLADFDIVFAFPWPNDEDLTNVVFDRFASHGSLLLTYDEIDNYRLYRKQTD